MFPDGERRQDNLGFHHQASARKEEGSAQRSETSNGKTTGEINVRN